MTIIHIPLVTGPLGDQPVSMVDARLLHEFLDIGRDFSNWIRGRIAEYGFEAGIDFVKLDSPNSANQVGHGGDRRRQQYLLTLDMAKELAMVERTSRGRDVRRYFIACEKRLRAQRVQQAMHRVPMTDEDYRRINQQAWARASAEIQAAFNAHRDALLAERQVASTPNYVIRPAGWRPSWAH